MSHSLKETYRYFGEIYIPIFRIHQNVSKFLPDYIASHPRRQYAP